VRIQKPLGGSNPPEDVAVAFLGFNALLFLLLWLAQFVNLSLASIMSILTGENISGPIANTCAVVSSQEFVFSWVGIHLSFEILPPSLGSHEFLW
jgi:hypothetical protein